MNHPITKTLAALLGLAFVLTHSTSAAPQNFADAVLADSPYAFFRLGESSGTTAADSSGNSRNGSFINSPTLGVAGSGGGDTAVTFNGTNQSVNLTNMSGFGAALGSSSLEFVLRTTETQRRFLTGTINNNSTTAFQIELNTSATGGTLANATRFFIRSEEGHFLSAAFTNATLFSGNFAHLVFTFDNAGSTNNDRLQVYVNGVSQSLTFDGASNISNSSTFAAFGYNLSLAARNNRSNNAADFAAVTLDEVAFYTSTLSASQVQTHFNAIPEPRTVGILTGLLALGFVLFKRRR